MTVDLTAALAPSGPHHLALVFDSPPHEEGQLGRTSLARTFKPRFSYGWDWGVRFVPIGARGRLELAWGEAAVFKPDGVGGSTFVQRVLFSEWATLP